MNRPSRILTLFIASAALAAGCGKHEEPPAPAPDMTATPPAPTTEAPAEQSARATLKPTQGNTAKPTQGNTASGELALKAVSDGVHLTGQLTGLRPASEHAIHVHEKGDCSAPDASSAGGHFNPDAKAHGDPEGSEHHAGDMFNIKADDQGNATVDTRAPSATLRDGAATDVLGKSVVLHEKADDYKTQPSGDSGDRIACGVVE